MPRSSFRAGRAASAGTRTTASTSPPSVSAELGDDREVVRRVALDDVTAARVEATREDIVEPRPRVPREVGPAAVGVEPAVAVREAGGEDARDRLARDVVEQLVRRRVADLVLRMNRVEVADEDARAVAELAEDRRRLLVPMRL